MKVQYAIYRTRLEAGKEVEIYLTASGGASEDHEQAMLLTSEQIRDGEMGPDEFPFIRIDPAVSVEAYFSENYNLFVEDRPRTIVAMATQDIITLKMAMALGLSEELSAIFFTMLREMLTTYVKTPGVKISWDRDAIESIPLSAFKGELQKILDIVCFVAPSIYTELCELDKWKKARLARERTEQQ